MFLEEEAVMTVLLGLEVIIAVLFLNNVKNSIWSRREKLGLGYDFMMITIEFLEPDK